MTQVLPDDGSHAMLDFELLDTDMMISTAEDTRMSLNPKVVSKRLLHAESRLDGTILPVKLFAFWLEALKKNDHQYIKRTLMAISPSERMMLVTGRFDFTISSHENELTSAKLPRQYECYYPIMICAIYGCKESVQCLRQHMASVLVKEYSDNNIIHILIHACDVSPSHMEGCLEMFSLLSNDICNHEELRELLLSENELGLRPIELSIALGIFPFFEVIVETEGVYSINSEIHALHRCTLYDVTDYTVGQPQNRLDRSILHLLTYSDNSDVEKPFNLNTLTASPIIKAWSHIRHHQLKPLIMFSCALRFLFGMMFFITVAVMTTDSKDLYNLNSVNQSDAVVYMICQNSGTYGMASCVSQCIILVHAIIGVLQLVSAIVAHFKNLCQKPYYLYLNRYKGSMVVSSTFYATCEMTQSLLIVTSIGITFMQIGGEVVMKVQAWCFAIAIFLNVWYILRVVQLVPSLSHFVSTLQRMLKDMAYFLIVYIVIFICFVILFYFLLSANDDFSDFFIATYSTFKVMINMIDLSKMKSVDLAIVITAHFTYVMIVAILLLNFLIAILSQSVGDVTERKKVIKTLQDLAILAEVESSVHYQLILKTVMKNYQQKGFVRKNGRLYLPVWRPLSAGHQ